MLGLVTARSLCPFCEASAIARSSNYTAVRHASTIQRRKPSRMVLSERVARPSPEAVAARGKPVRKSKNSPWGGLNRTTAPPELELAKQQQASAAERKRASRFTKPGKDDKQRDPMKALKMQQRLTNLSYGSRSRIKRALDARDSFAEFPLLPAIHDSIVNQALRGMVDVVPTPVQRLAIPALLDQPLAKRRRSANALHDGDTGDMRQFLLAAETGSGKTLAYVIPVVDAIKRAEARAAEEQSSEAAAKEEAIERKRGAQRYELEAPVPPEVTMARPRAIILVPTAELVAQVGAVLKSLSHTVKFRTAMLSAAFSPTVIRNRLYAPSGVDVVVSTPHLLNSIATTDPHILSKVSHLVIDEADSLLDRSFSPITSNIIDRATPSLQQLIFCSATIPKSLDGYINKRYPFTKRLATPNLHAIPRRVQLSVIDIDQIPYQGNRDLACAQTIWDLGKDSDDGPTDREQQVVVFVNERDEATRLAEYLREKGVDALAFSRDSDDRSQSEVLASFTGTSTTSAPSPRETPDASASGMPDRRRRQQLQHVKVLVMTDLGSRGIDTVQVRTVILYDVPHTSIDFIHRLGRLGRMGRRGRGIVLVGRHDRKDVVREVREGMHRGQALI